MSETTKLAKDRVGLEILPPHECWALLSVTPVGRVAFHQDGEPHVFPVTHGVKKRAIFFRTGPGTKLEAARMADVVAFEADEWDSFSKTGWSVLARGVAETVYDHEEIAELESTGVAPWLDSAHEHGTWVRIQVDEISGRRLPL